MLIGLTAALAFESGCGKGTAPGAVPPGPTAEDIRAAKSSEQSLRERGFTDADSPALSADEQRAATIAKKLITDDPGPWLYRVEHDAKGWHVMAMPHNYIDSRGVLLHIPAGDFFTVDISEDWKEVKVVGGA